MSRRQPSATVCAVTPLHQGFLKVSLYRFAVERFDGSGVANLEREVMERGHAVGVLGYDPKRDEVVLVCEFRPGCFVAGDDPFTANVVAGVIAPGETPAQAAVREMREEAGLDLLHPIVVHPGAYVSSGGTSEKIAIVVGIVDTSRAGGVHGNPEEQEDILTVVLTRSELIERARGARITDLKTLVAVNWLAENYRNLASE